MLEKRRLGPTLEEFALSALTPEIAQALRRAVTIEADGSAKIDFRGPAHEVAQVASFLARMGGELRYNPRRISDEDFEVDAWEIADWVVRNQLPVEIEMDGRVVHLSPGPAPSEPIDLYSLAARARRETRSNDGRKSV